MLLRLLFVEYVVIVAVVYEGVVAAVVDESIAVAVYNIIVEVGAVTTAFC